jgi:hypothetical protein
MPPLLMPDVTPLPEHDCAQAIEHNDQSPTINQAMAVLVVEMFRKLVMRKLNYMASYIDLDVGSLSYIQAEPANVARIVGINEKDLYYHYGDENK